MYERNAVVLERYFNQMFGYNMKNNIKTNFEDYCELVDCLEKYHNISEEEENVIQEYDSIANKIREIQKLQENLNKKNIKLQEERASVIQNIGDNASSIQKKLDTVNSNIQNINDEIKENGQKFVDVVGEFNDKSLTRSECGRARRNIESEYNKKLNETLDNYQDIDIEYERKAKSFIELETDSIEQEIKDKMEKNGEKEKTPFNSEVISKAISLSIDIQKRETDILANIYDKTNRLFTEIKNNSVRIEKHKKIIRDAKCKLDFIAAIKEYLVQFLDNERLTSVNGEEEHTRLMQEACKNLDDDLIQINNLYTLLLKESSKKITKKSYPELYNFEYLTLLEDKSDKFDAEIKKLNLPVTVINPNHWRIEGMQKIFNIFINCVTEIYDRDLSEFMPVENQDENIQNNENDIDDYEDDLSDDIENEDDELDNNEETKTSDDDEEDAKTEIDKKIDMILGFSGTSNDSDDDDWADDEEELVLDDEDDEDWDDDLVIHDEDDLWDDNEDDETDDEEDDEDDFDDENDDTVEEDDEDEEVNFDIWGNNINKKSKKDDDEEDDDDSDSNDLWDDDLIFGDADEDDEEDDDETIDDEDIIEKTNKEERKTTNKGKHHKPNTKKQGKNKTKEIDTTEENEEWADQFIKKDKPKKKKGLFDKFKR